VTLVLRTFQNNDRLWAIERRGKALTIRHGKAAGYDGTNTLEVFAPQKEYLLLSRDLLRRWWAEA
jgi:predicted DNA-binding WGR domain protein